MWQNIAHNQPLLSALSDLSLPLQTLNDVIEALYRVYVEPAEDERNVSSAISRFREISSRYPRLFHTRRGLRRPPVLKSFLIFELCQPKPNAVLCNAIARDFPREETDPSFFDALLAQVRDEPSGIRRRFHLVPFSVTIPPEEQNINLKTELRDEADGVLAWAVAGCLEWQRQGRLNPPEIILATTAEYLESEDVLEMWLSECCLRGSDHEERTAYLYESFRRWKQDRGEQPPGQKTFTNRLTERGYPRDRDKYGWKMTGLRLESEERTLIEAAINDRRSGENKREWWSR
jgi:hypothetical protein